MSEIVETVIKMCTSAFVIAFTSSLIVGMIIGIAVITKWAIKEIFKDE